MLLFELKTKFNNETIKFLITICKIYNNMCYKFIDIKNFVHYFIL